MSCSTLSSLPGAIAEQGAADQAGGGVVAGIPNVAFGVNVVEAELMAWYCEWIRCVDVLRLWG